MSERTHDLIWLGEPADRAATLARDVRDGLGRPPRTLPVKWLYDARGSELFEALTAQPEYYPTDVEASILDDVADELVAGVRPRELVEVGSGSSRKTRRLLDALITAGGDTYVGLDVSVDAVRQAGAALAADYPQLRIVGAVGDFDVHLGQVPRSGRRLVALLGSTIGNDEPAGQVAFLRRLAGMLDDEDALLLGVDLVKDVAVLEAAYDDAAGVTRAFTANVLHVLHGELGAQIDFDAFRSYSTWRPDAWHVELGLVAERPTTIRFPTLDLEVPFEVGETIRTEVSSKYTKDLMIDRLADAGLALDEWHVDGREWFAVALARPG